MVETWRRRRDRTRGRRYGVGAGWNREEMADHGTDARVRMAIMRERVEAMQAIWTSEEASYDGEHVSFQRIWTWPKPCARLARLATVDARGRPHLVPIVFALDADRVYHAVDHKPKRTTALRRLDTIAADPRSR